MNIYGINGIPLEAQYLYRRGVELSSQKKYEAAIKVSATGDHYRATVLPGHTGSWAAGFTISERGRCGGLLPETQQDRIV